MCLDFTAELVGIKVFSCKDRRDVNLIRVHTLKKGDHYNHT